MHQNPLMQIAEDDRHSTCCGNHFCRDCGAHVSTYNANDSLIAARPEAETHDWWVACDNHGCKHSYGEGLFQMLPDWIEERAP